MNSAYKATFLAKGRGPLLVFLHGIGGNCRSFADQLTTFSYKRRCVAWNMPGYGSSPLPSQLTFSMMADALNNMLDELGASDADLVGHSMGGMVAQDFVARYPRRVRSLILTGTSPAFGKQNGEWQKKFLESRLNPLIMGQTPSSIAQNVVTSMFADTSRKEEIKKAVAIMSELSTETYKAALECLTTFDRRKSLANIRCPVLCLAAENDTIAPPTVLKKMAEIIPGGLYRCLPGVGHLANIEAPISFNLALESFLIK